VGPSPVCYAVFPFQRTQITFEYFADHITLAAAGFFGQDGDALAKIIWQADRDRWS